MFVASIAMPFNYWGAEEEEREKKKPRLESREPQLNLMLIKSDLVLCVNRAAIWIESTWLFIFIWISSPCTTLISCLWWSFRLLFSWLALLPNLTRTPKKAPPSPLSTAIWASSGCEAATAAHFFLFSSHISKSALSKADMTPAD